MPGANNASVIFIACIGLLASTKARPASQENQHDIFSLDLKTLATLEVNPSADASSKGLSKTLAGGQLGEGMNMGILGNRPITEVPFSVTSYTQSSILDSMAPSVGEVLQYDPTVRVARGFGNFQQLYRVRGFHIFSDDMLYNGLYGLLPRQYLSSQLIERVEITRGVSGFLNGPTSNNSSLGGVVNVMPKRATLEPITRLNMGYESEQQWLVAADLGRRSEDKRYGMRLNAITRDGETAVNNASRQLDLTTIGLDYSGKVLRISADFGYQDLHLDELQPSIDFAINVPVQAAPDSDQSISQPWNYSDERDWFGSLHMQYDVSATTTGWLAAGVREGREDSIFLSSLTVNNSDGDITADRFDVKHEDSVFTAKAGLSIEWQSGPLNHVTTMEATTYENKARNAYAIYSGVTDNLYQHQNVELPTMLNFSGGDFNAPGITQTIRRKSYAVVDQISQGKRWNLLIGVRMQHFHDDLFDYDTQLEQSSYSQHLTTPLLAGLLRHGKHLFSYFNYCETALAAGVAPSTNSQGVVTNAGKSVEPTRNKQLELGLKWNGKRGGGSISLYQIQQPMLGFDSNNRYGDIDEDETHKGIEWLFYGRMLNSLSANGGITLMKTDAAGNDAIGVPQRQANLNLAWDLMAVSGLTLNAYLIYTGDNYADTGNLKTVPSWWRGDIGARYARQWDNTTQITLRVKIENLTNREYWASTGGYPGFGYLTVSQPRTLLASVSIDF